MKRILALLLCGVLFFGFAACGGTEDPSDLSGTSSGSSDVQTGGGTDASSDGTQEGTSSEIRYDPEMDHKVILDDSSNIILVLDLDDMGEITDLESLEDAIVWQWDSRTDPKCVEGNGRSGVDEANIRYSAYWEKDVVIACGSSGWVGIIDYETRNILFEDRPGFCPHSVELLPNGDLIVAGSGGDDWQTEGCLLYYPLSTGSTEYCFKTQFPSAHGVCWDPENELLWALGYSEVRAYQVSGMGTESAKLVHVQGMGASLTEAGDSSGHDLSPVYGQPGKYWVTASKKLWLFDSEEGTLTDKFKYSSDYTGTGLKGVAYFPDGTMVQSGYIGEGGDPEYMSTALKVVYLTESSGKVKKILSETLEIPHAAGRQTYKVHAFTKDYQ